MNNMTPEQKRIEIAEACGIISEDQWGKLYRTPNGIVRRCPDYFNDLNAMHEAMLLLSPRNLSTMMCILMQMGVDRNFNFFAATAEEQAEAFLRTIGKWTANPNEALQSSP